MKPKNESPKTTVTQAETSVMDARWLLGMVAAAWLLPLVVGILLY